MAMGIVMKFYSLFVIALTLYMMLYKTMKEKLVGNRTFPLRLDSHEGALCRFLSWSLHHGLHEPRDHLRAVRIAVQSD